MEKKSVVKIGLVGNGARGRGILSILLGMEDVEILAVCDVREDKLEDAKGIFERKRPGKTHPLYTKDYKDLIKMEEIDAIVNTASWAGHVHVAVDAMRAGKDVALEVGGAYSIQACWDLVRAQEETGRRCMMLENCCYGRTEMAVLNMAKKGIFGKIVHCEGGYGHDLRDLLVDMPFNGRERLVDYTHRNCENYPTHALGPIAKILDINRGNRMLTLTSTASVSAGLADYVARNCAPDHPMQGGDYALGDIITTTIKCAHGETITLTLDTTLPRAYTRHFTVQGTRGMYTEDGHTVFIDGIENAEGHPEAKTLWGNADKYFDEYDHPIWEGKRNSDQQNGVAHGGIDRMVLRAFVESIEEDVPVPIDVYDCAAWMCITPLSEMSVAMGGAPVGIPDFTDGRWVSRKFEQVSKWSI